MQICVSLIDESKMEDTKGVSTAVDVVKIRVFQKAKRFSVNIVRRKLLFRRNLLFVADLHKSSIKTRFYDQHN